MWKIYIYPFWKCSLVEEYLETMEHRGFRVEKVYFGYLFQFKIVPPKSVCFVYSRSIMKDNEMHLHEYELRKDYHAVEIPVLGVSGVNIHRICMPNVDLNAFVSKRTRYMRQLIIVRIIFILIYLLGSICAAIAYNGVIHGFRIVVFGLCILLIYHVIGYIDIVIRNST